MIPEVYLKNKQVFKMGYVVSSNELCICQEYYLQIDQLEFLNKIFALLAF